MSLSKITRSSQGNYSQILTGCQALPRRRLCRSFRRWIGFCYDLKMLGSKGIKGRRETLFYTHAIAATGSLFTDLRRENNLTSSHINALTKFSSRHWCRPIGQYYPSCHDPLRGRLAGVKMVLGTPATPTSSWS